MATLLRSPRWPRGALPRLSTGDHSAAWSRADEGGQPLPQCTTEQHPTHPCLSLFLLVAGLS